MNIAILSAEYISSKKDAIDFIIEIDGVKVPYTYVIADKNDSEVASFIKHELANGAISVSPYSGPSDYEILVSSVREKRNHLLEESDFFMSVPDYPITDAQREEIKVYRQALRNIPQQEGFPESVIWPEPPDCI